MNSNDLVLGLEFELEELGYSQKLELKNKQLLLPKKQYILKPGDLFFLDAIFEIQNELIVLVISAPLYSFKGTLTVEKERYEELKSNGYQDAFQLKPMAYDEESPAVRIDRQYNMRKIRRSDFSADRYILRRGFPDFPPCPYGHTFQSLGYDLQEKEYVRLAPAVLKKEEICLEVYE